MTAFKITESDFSEDESVTGGNTEITLMFFNLVQWFRENAKADLPVRFRKMTADIFLT